MAGVLETRYEKGGDVTYIADTALLAGRLVKFVSEGTSKTKPEVGYTAAAIDLPLGAVFADAAANEQVGVSHRVGSWQKLEAAAAIAAGVEVQPAANGRVETKTGTNRVYGVTLHAAAQAGDKVWVKVL